VLVGRDHLIATAQIVLPQLPVTEFEQLGKLKGACSFTRRGSLFLSGNTFIGLGLIFLFPWLAALRDYRSWKLEQVALATGFQNPRRSPRDASR